MVITLSVAQREFVAGLMQAKQIATRELDLVLTAIRAGQGPGEFKGVQLEGDQLRFLDEDAS